MPVSEIHWSWIDLGKLCLAVVLGFIIGYNRAIHHKPAGVTTMSIVTLASTLMMELSYQLSASGIGPAGADPARLAAAVMTGIGFLGAGVIMQTGGHIQGITTAATIWIMTAIGLAIGAGYYLPALVAFGLLLLGVLVSPAIDRLVAKHAARIDESYDDTINDRRQS